MNRTKLQQRLDMLKRDYEIQQRIKGERGRPWFDCEIAVRQTVREMDSITKILRGL